MEDQDLNRYTTLENVDGEMAQEIKLRPGHFGEYIGQKKVVENLKLMVESAKIRNKPLDHVLFSGPPGLGKTSLALLLSKEMQGKLQLISGPALEKKGDLAAILTNLTPGDILFIDEIHRIDHSIEELLYSAMEDFRLDIVIGQGVGARTMQIDLAPFTLIGATTKAGLLTHPLRDRFLGHFNFNFYQPSELIQILAQNAQKLQLPAQESALQLIAERCRGTPRIANRILRRVRDHALVLNYFELNSEVVLKALEMMEIDHLGLDAMDRKILSIIENYYQGGPVGIDALCATLQEDKHSIEDVFEPYLLQQGLILRTPRGRFTSQAAKDHLSKMAADGILD